MYKRRNSERDGTYDTGFSAWVVVPVCGLLASGCATIATKPPRFEDEPIRVVRNQVPSKEAIPHAKLELDGTSLTLIAVRDCDLVDRPVVRRTTRIESYNASPVTDWLLAAGGTGLAVWGGATLIDSRHVYASDASSRTYNPIGPAGSVGIGVGLSVAGLGLLALVGVDLVRANREEVTTATVTLDGQPTRRGLACLREPYAGAALIGEVDKATFALGVTDAQGHLSVDLDQAMPSAWVVPRAARMRVTLANSDIGQVELAAVYQVREARAWANADSERCASPKDPQDCSSLHRFVSAYGDGPHGPAARTILAGSETAIRQLSEGATWKNVDTAGCLKGDDPDAILGACQRVRTFIREFPDGAHAKEAEVATRTGEARAVALRAAIQRKQRAAEAAEQQQEIARRAQAKSDCVRIIQAACQRVSWRFPYDICVRKAMEAQNGCAQE